MKSFFNRHEEDIEDFLEEEEEDLDIIDLDETAGWSKLDVAEELAKQQATNLLEEIGDELAIIDAVEEDVEIEELDSRKTEAAITYAAAKAEMPARMIQELSEEELELEELSDADLEIEQLQDDDLEIEHLQDDDLEYLSKDEEEDEEDDEEYEEESPFVFFENLAAWFSRWTMMDKIVAVTGVLVLVVAILTVGVYAGNRGVNKQIEAFAPVGEQLETIGIVGQDKLLAVADAKKAMLEAAKLEAELNQEYEENELSSEVKVIMKMTSVQKDLKIKFVNKKSGKLVGNVPFEVKIVDPDNKTYNKIDEDMDGIIYLTKITPGNYSVSMVELADVEGYSFSTSTEKIKVKENIAYEKIDVSDEIKDQSEVDVSKEDTAQKTETEATLTDTVEWVESTKKESSSQETYTSVDKSTIADPALSASLNLDLGILRIMQQSMLADNVVVPLTDDSLSDNNPDINNPDTENPDGGNAGGEQNTIAVSGITIDSSLSIEKGKTATLTASVTPENATNKTVTWSTSDGSVATVTDGVVSGVKAGTATITAKAGEKTATCAVTVVDPTSTTVAVTGVTLNSTTLELEVGETGTVAATVAPENATDKTVTWSSDKTDIATVDSTGKVTAVKEGTTTITAKAGEKTATCTVTVKAKGTVSVTGVTVNPATVKLDVGKTTVLGVTITPENATEKGVTWKSSDESKATVDAKGCVTAKAEGTVTITATTKDGSKTASCTVTISKSYDPKTDTTKLLKDKSGNQIYVLVNGQYVEAKVADYYKYTTFYKKEKVSQYVYTGWQNLDGKTYYFDKNGNKVTGEQVIQGAKYNFNSDGTLNTGSGILGIDVSTWNGNIDWNKVKNSGVSYVIIRTGFRGSTQGSLVEDNKFRQNIKGATNAGLKVGVYFFSQAINEVEAVEEASMVLSQVKGYKLAYPVFIDVEPSGGRADSLSSGDRTKVINAFCQTIQNGGYRAGIYANKTWLSQKMNVSALSGYKIWLAQYNSKVTYAGRYDMWQYSDKGTVSGISGKVDMNLSYLSY